MYKETVLFELHTNLRYAYIAIKEMYPLRWFLNGILYKKWNLYRNIGGDSGELKVGCRSPKHLQRHVE